MRGVTHVPVIVPLSSDDLAIARRLTDAQAERLWRQVATERAGGATVVQAFAEAAVAHLRRAPKHGYASPSPRCSTSAPAMRVTDG